MSLILYDIVLLVVFALFLGYYLYSGRKNLKKEGLLLLYRTSWGMKIIEKVGNKYTKTLKYLGYVSILCGYFLMFVSIYLIGRIVYIYTSLPSVVREVKVPPIVPLVPYLPQVFNLSFLPPFYFVYWIVILAVIAIPHELAHGIFMARNKIKIKSTGFGFFPFFLPVFLAAFVEQDEKSMVKAKKMDQLAVLSAGTFANIISAVLFFVVLWLFFAVSFGASGVIFDSYAYGQLNKSDIKFVNGISVEDSNILDLLNENFPNIISSDKSDYVISKDSFVRQQSSEIIVATYDSPALVNNLTGAITSINGESVKKKEDIGKILEKYSSGDEIEVTTYDGEERTYNIVLGENPETGKAWLGIGFINRQLSGFGGFIYKITTSFKDPNVYYKPLMGGFSIYFYNLLWWLVIILISVAIVNMLPVGIFDGGRFFYLTVLGLTKSEKAASLAFSLVTYLFLIILGIVMVFWAISVF